jgi:hypothetical protein
MPRLIQNILTPLWELKKIKGIDNVTTDDLHLTPGYVRVAENVDIDTENIARRRKGILQKIVDGSGHSGWSEGSLCFLVLDGNIVQLNTDWTTTMILPSVGPSKMKFIKIDQRVFFSNLWVTGYLLNGTAYPFSDNQVRKDRQKMVGGGLIEYHNARLYSEEDGFIYRSIAGNPFEVDVKRDHIYLGGPITMLIGVNGPEGENGLYVSGDGKCVYLSNLEPSLEAANYKPLLDIPALPGSAIGIDRMILSGRLVGRVAMWSTIEGIFMGLPGGKVRDLTGEHYFVLGIERGFALVRDIGGYRQYIYMGEASAGLGLASMEFIESVPTILASGSQS